MSQSLFRCLSHIITTEVLWNSFKSPPQRSLFAWCLSVKTVLSDRRGEVSIFQIKIDFGATGICFSPIRAFVPCHLQDHIIPTQNKRIKCIMCFFLGSVYHWMGNMTHHSSLPGYSARTLVWRIPFRPCTSSNRAHREESLLVVFNCKAICKRPTFLSFFSHLHSAMNCPASTTRIQLVKCSRLY